MKKRQFWFVLEPQMPIPPEKQVLSLFDNFEERGVRLIFRRLWIQAEKVDGNVEQTFLAFVATAKDMICDGCEGDFNRISVPYADPKELVAKARELGHL